LRGLVFLAGSADRITVWLGIPYAREIWLLRAAVLVLPVVALLVTRQLCTEIREERRPDEAHVQA